MPTLKGIERFIYNNYLMLRLKLSKHSYLYVALIALVGFVRPNQRTFIVKRDTELVIEGFPRSANTFFYCYADLAQNSKVTIAHHLHEPYQIRRAVELSLPCVVLFRDPSSAVVSAQLRDPRVHQKTLLSMYEEFYAEVFSTPDKVVLAEFSAVTKAPGDLISRVNKVYGTNFQTEVSSLDEVWKHVDALDSDDQKAPTPLTVARPSDEKQKAGAQLRLELKKSHGPQLIRCERLYESLLSLYNRQSAC